MRDCGGTRQHQRHGRERWRAKDLRKARDGHQLVGVTSETTGRVKLCEIEPCKEVSMNRQGGKGGNGKARVDWGFGCGLGPGDW